MTCHLSASQVHCWCVIICCGSNFWIYFTRWSLSRSSRASFTPGNSELSSDSADADDAEVSKPVSLVADVSSPSGGDRVVGKLWEDVPEQMPSSALAACRVTSLIACPSNWTPDSAASHRSEASANWARHRSNRLATLPLSQRQNQCQMHIWLKTYH